MVAAPRSRGEGGSGAGRRRGLAAAWAEPGGLRVAARGFAERPSRERPECSAEWAAVISADLAAPAGRVTAVRRGPGGGEQGCPRGGDCSAPRHRWTPPKLRRPSPLLAASKPAIYYYFLIYIFFFIFAWKSRKRSENWRVASPASRAPVEERGGPEGGGPGAAERVREPPEQRGAGSRLQAAASPHRQPPPQPPTHTPPPLLFSFWIHAAIQYPPGLSLLFFCTRACCPGQQRERGLCKTGQIKMSDIILFDRMIQNDKVPSPEGARMVNS